MADFHARMAEGARALLLVALIVVTPLTAIAGQEATRHDHLRIKSLLLVKPQCEQAIAGYAGKIAPHFARWRQRQRKAIDTIEQSAGFQDTLQAAVAYTQRMSPRARTGLAKDCEKIYQTLKQQQ
jgi:hypothetical protein